jgi:hypothetical protein
MCIQYDVRRCPVAHIHICLMLTLVRLNAMLVCHYIAALIGEGKAAAAELDTVLI